MTIKIKVYLAAPFFTPEQIAMVEKLEDLLASFGFYVFSPRKVGGVLKDMPLEEQEAKAEEIFLSNVYGVRNTQVLLAWTDTRDFGVGVEMGIAYQCGNFIIGYT